MSGIFIEHSECTGCGLCRFSCPSGAIELKDIAQVDAAICTLCGLCVDSCPQGAIRLKKEKAETAADLTPWKGVWVFAEQKQGQPVSVVLELLSKGRELADSLKQPLSAVLLGGGEAACSLLGRHGADMVYLCSCPGLQLPDEQTYLPVLAALVREHKPSILLFGATGFGRSLAPRLAAHLKTGLTADCTGLEIDAETSLLKQTRPAFGGNLMATIVCASRRPQMATVRPGVFPAVDKGVPGAKIIPVPEPDPIKLLVRLLSEETAGQAESIAAAPFILSVGRGIGNQKNLKLAQELAKRLGAQLGASRPLVEEGWLPYHHQIGQTGCSVAPRLLMTFGISGAVQHLAGIGGAQCIVAVNSDPEAPIVAAAHYAVVGDCQEILREMLAKLDSVK